MSTEQYTTQRASMFVQPDGPNTRPYYIGCRDVGDIAEPQGAVELIRCFLADGSGWKVIAKTQAPPDAVTFDMTIPVGTEADWVEKIRCPASFFINLSDCGRVDQFSNYGRSFAFPNTLITNKGLTQVVRREEDLPVQMTFEFAADPPMLRLWTMKTGRQATTSTEDLNDIAFCNDAKCADACGVAQPICDDGIIMAATAATSPGGTSAILQTGTGGAAWAATAADPFAAGEDNVSGVCFPISPTVTRWLVVRDTDAAAALEVAYSDDGGATWVMVVVGAVVAQEALGPGALDAIDMYNIWLVTDGGYIYKSEDGGVTWTTQSAGLVTTNDLFAVWAADEANVMAVGDTDTVLITNDGGDTWTLTTATGGGNTLLTVNWSFGFWWIGDDGGELWYSNTDGTVWNARTEFPGYGVGEIPDIKFVNELCGFLAYNTAAPIGTVYRTRDGGYTWETTPYVTNVGINALWGCDSNMAFAVGDVVGGTGYIQRSIGSIHA